MSTKNAQPGFTLVELLVVMAIVGVLVGMTLPAVQVIRESARRAACSNKLRQQVLALLNYESAFGKFPAGAESTTSHSWCSRILPFLEQSALFDQVDFERLWSDETNLPILATNLDVFSCPSSSKDYPGKTDYCGIRGSSFNTPINIGRNGLLFPVSERKPAVGLSEITDGSSNTILVAEAVVVGPRDFGFWGCGLHCVSHEEGPINYGVNLGIRYSEIASEHPGGAWAVFADGSTRFLTQDLSVATVSGLCTRNNGEVVTDFN